MTRFQALFIKFLRVRCGGSWRWVAATYDDRYVGGLPFDGGMTIGGNQLTGILLCEEAMRILGEEDSEEWS